MHGWRPGEVLVKPTDHDVLARGRAADPLGHGTVGQLEYDVQARRVAEQPTAAAQRLDDHRAAARVLQAHLSDMPFQVAGTQHRQHRVLNRFGGPVSNTLNLSTRT